MFRKFVPPTASLLLAALGQGCHKPAPLSVDHEPADGSYQVTTPITAPAPVRLNRDGTLTSSPGAVRGPRS